MSSPHIIERNAICISGQLGSLYDASSETFLNCCSFKKLDNSQYQPNFTLHISRGKEDNNTISFLKKINFNDALLQSILFGLVTPSGVSSFVNYNHSINENTLFLYYSYGHTTQKLNVTAMKADKAISLPSNSNNATHMVTEIIYGFEILCVIHGLTMKSIDTIEKLLHKIWSRVPSDNKSFELTGDEQHQINELHDVTIYGSETCINNSNASSFLTVLTHLQEWHKNSSFYHPILYRMCSLEWLYEGRSFLKLCLLSNDDNSYIEQIGLIIMQTDHKLKNLQQMYKSRPKNDDNLISDKWLEDTPERLGILFSIYDEYRTKLQSKLVDIRRGTGKLTDINSEISEERYSSLKAIAINTFRDELEQWLTKHQLIKKLQDGNITYFNINIFQGSNHLFTTIQYIDEVINTHFSKEYGHVVLWYSSDRLKRENSDEWERLYTQIIEKRQKSNEQISLIYVDFSHCQYKLTEYRVRDLSLGLPSKTQNKNRRGHRLPEPSQEITSLPSSLPSKTKTSSVTELNVLLMGETGVGKSTFINAFVNYLSFDTLEQAEQNKPIVLIPVSFLLTIGNQFNEFTVKLGNIDSNENHEHQGQSVTQECKSYVFNLNEQLRLRLIDTPGMGDTRGFSQDEKNIDHIITYINNLSHLNAISTFFAPGDTGPLLQEIIVQEYRNEILFKKNNTFCFDSESFRYLAARKCNVDFDEFIQQESINSWKTSVTESVRLLKFILRCKPYYLNDEQSVRKAALDIRMLSRPLMETLRSILYNWKLCETGYTTHKIILNSNSVTSKLCTKCVERKMVTVEHFHKIEYESKKRKTAQDCLCSIDEEHFLIEHIVKYELISEAMDQSCNQLENRFSDLLLKCDKLAHFLRQKELSTSNDPFALVLEKFFEEQQQICQTPNIDHTMNKKILDSLQSIKKMRMENQQKLLDSDENYSLSKLYQLVNQLKHIPDVEKQINSIEKSRQFKMQANEYRVELPLNRSKIFADFSDSK
ncbi:unnamed protein product [Rotaria sp. Silwood1]|nr:unnamed protein product [Rotaria sp. Silwood1]